MLEKRRAFAKLREEHIARHWRASGLRKADEAERLLKKEFASWDDRPAADITADDVDSIITGIVDRGALGQARNVFGYLRGMYAWAMANRRYGIRTSPCDGFEPAKMFGTKPTRDRWLRDDELRTVWNATPALGIAAPVVRLLILTACRLNEIAGLRWEEIGETEITIPGSRMKGKVDHLLPTKKGIKKNYNLHDYAQEKHDALIKWETALAGILNPRPSTVEDFDAARARRVAS